MRRSVQHAVQNLVDDTGAHRDQHHIRPRPAPFITGYTGKREGVLVQAFAVVTAVALAAYQAHIRRRAPRRTGRGYRG